MAYAQKIDGLWVALSSAMAVTYIAMVVPPYDQEGGEEAPPAEPTEMIASYDTVTSWTDQERADVGIYTVGDGDPPPAGKQIVSSTIGDKKGRPVFVNVFGDIPPPPRVAKSPISDRQFFQALAMPAYGIISPQEALDAVKTGEIPAVMQVVIDQLPPDQQFAATMLIAGGTIYERDNPLVTVFGASQSMDDEMIDEFWDFAGTL